MNTKNILTTLVVFAMLFVPAISGAQQDQKGIHEAGTGLEDPALKEAMQGSGQGMMDEEEMEEEMDDMTEEMGNKMFREEAAQRRSQVANSVQEMERIAERNQGIGEQIRVIAQNQNKIQEEAESALQVAQQRKGFAKFLIGPNYGQLKDIEDRLEDHTANLEELRDLRDEITVASDREALSQQIEIMEQIKVELENAANEEQKGFSLFGWLNKLMTK